MEQGKLGGKKNRQGGRDAECRTQETAEKGVECR